MQHVEAIVNAGTSTTYGQAAGRTQTVLARQLAFADKPTFKPFWDWGTLWAVMFLDGIAYVVIAFIVAFVQIPNLGDQVAGLSTLARILWGQSFIPLIIAGTLLAAVIIRGFDVDHRNRTYVQGRLPLWEKLYNYWHTLYYCHRCNSLFVPGTADSITVDQVGHYLTERLRRDLEEGQQSTDTAP